MGVSQTRDNLLVLLVSYDTNLNDGESYVTPLYIPVGGYHDIGVTLKGDVDITVLFMFSNDKVNVDAQHTENYVANSEPLGLEIPVIAPWLKVSITNAGGVRSTTLRCFVWGKK